MDLESVVLDVPTGLSGASFAAGGESGAVYQGAVGAGAHLFQDADVAFDGDFSYTFFYNGVGAGAAAPGWMDVSAGSRGVAMGLRHFWQTFPHKLSATGSGGLRLELVPAESDKTFWTVYPGVGKTYEAFLDLHAGGYSSSVRRRAELALTPPLLVAEPAWYAASGVFGPLAPPSSRTGHYETKMAKQYNCTAFRSGCSIYPRIFGQRDFGDYQQGVGTRSDGTKFSNYGDGHYEDAHGMLLQFVRTADRKWLDLAAPYARHHYDLDVMHAQNPPRYPGYPPGMIHWHGTAEHEGVNIEFGHVVPGGLDEYYYLTGDPRALDVIREQGDWVDYWARIGRGRVAPERDGDRIGGEEYERVGAWTLYTLLKSYQATNDPKYWESASILVKNNIDWWKMPQDHIVFDPKRQLDLTRPPAEQALYYQRSDWTTGTGYTLPTLRVANCAQTTAPLDNRAYQSHAPIGWMSALLQTTLIRYYEELERRGGVYDATVQYRGQATPIRIDLPTLREMLIQIINMVVDHVYVGAPEYASKYPWLSTVDLDHFVYSVCPDRDPRLGNGDQYFPWTLSFVSSFPQSAVSSRWQGSWSQLQSKWRAIARQQYINRVIRDTSPLTGYNGVQEMWSMPYALPLMEQLGLLDDLGSAPAPPPAPTDDGSSSPSTSGSTTSTSTTPTSGSLPAYRVNVSGGSLFLTSPTVDLDLVFPSQAVQVNVSAAGFGQGQWQQVASEIHAITLPPGAGTKTLYLQFRDSGGAVLASLRKDIVLLEAGFSGTVTLTLNEAEDTFVFSNSAGSNYGARTYVTAGLYSAGYDNWGLVSFPIPALPAGVQATVESARLEVYLTENTRNTSQIITPYEPTAPWAEDTVTWSSRPALATTALGGGVTFTSRSEVGRWKAFPLTLATVQGWLEDPSRARGIVLKGEGTPNLTSVQFASSESFHAGDDRRPRLVLQLALAHSDTVPPLISAAQAADVGETAATIQWTTDEEADGLVEFGTTTGYGQQAAQPARSTSHAVVLRPLLARTTYHARATSRDAAGNATSSPDLVFTTTGPMPGDLNRDGQLTLADVTALAGQLLGLAPVTPLTADVNGDGRVSTADLQTLVNRL
jgi:hypothetical protein